jgi:hypothetical protein
MQGIAQKILAQPGKYSIQQLTQAVQNGTLPAYIGVPIIQDKVQQQKQSQMMQQGQQAQQNAPPIAQQVMQEAQGLEALPSNLPQEYAGGGIVAFEEGGEVERYQNQGLVGSSPAGRFFGGLRQQGADYEESQRLRNELTSRYGLKSGLPGLFMNQSDEQRQGAKDVMGRLNTMTLPELQALYNQGPDALPSVAPPAANPTDARLAANKQVAPSAAPVAPPVALDKTKPNANLGGDSALTRKPDFGLKDPGTFTRPPGKSMAAQTMEQLGGYDGADGYLERSAAREKDLETAITDAKKSVTGEAFSDYKKVLEKEALDFGADKAQAKNMAIFKAGLAMMAGTSRNALENIGKGAMTGAEDYQAASKDIKKAQQENRKELSLIEQARRAEARGDRDTAIARLDASMTRKDSRDQYVANAMQKAYGIDRDEAFKMATTNFTTRADIFRADLAGQYGLAGQHIAGGYGLKAAQVRANRESGITPYQMANLRVTAQKNVDPDAVRAQLAKSLGLTKTPAPGADKGFDSKFNAQYENEVASYINRILGAGGGGGGDFGALNPVVDKYAPQKR